MARVLLRRTSGCGDVAEQTEPNGENVTTSRIGSLTIHRMTKPRQLFSASVWLPVSRTVLTALISMRSSNVLSPTLNVQRSMDDSAEGRNMRGLCWHMLTGLPLSTPICPTITNDL